MRLDRRIAERRGIAAHGVAGGVRRGKPWSGGERSVKAWPERYGQARRRMARTILDWHGWTRMDRRDWDRTGKAGWARTGLKR